MRVVVTGGAGFLGSHLCDRLLADGHRVVAVDNLITGRTVNISHNLENERFTYLRRDVSAYLDIEGEVDFVMHFASPGESDRLRARPDPDPEGRRPGYPQRPRPGQIQGRGLLPRVHL